MKKCPIQIIQEDTTKGGYYLNLKWITLLKDIDFEKGIYKNLIRFHPSSNENFFDDLFCGGGSNHFNSTAAIANFDIIRNPTMKEWMQLSNAAKKMGYKINLKTGECINLNTLINER